MKKDEPARPLGFCPACLALLARGCFRGLTVKLPDGRAFVGGYCAHNQVVAIRLELSEQEVGPWRMVCPVDDEERLPQMLLQLVGHDGYSPEPSELH